MPRSTPHRGRGVLVADDAAQNGGTEQRDEAGGTSPASNGTPANGTPANGSAVTGACKAANGDKKPELADRVKVWAGLLLGAFLAAVQLIGLKSGEISNILRNNIVAADVTGLLIVAAALTAVIGALIPAKSPMRLVWLPPIVAGLAATALLPVIVIQIPGTIPTLGRLAIQLLLVILFLIFVFLAALYAYVASRR